ncbi:MAG: hypothetical protein K0V04_38695 [Deltaproteobacteria bacterium]|nr:hypothetical protein [Deltaproteobacteria bacterium]
MHHGLLALVVTAACGAPNPRPGPVARQTSDKAALFGDPTLVPTRAGERARQEIALAHEIEHAARVLPAVARVRVDVELDRTPASTPAPPRALVVAQQRLDTDRAQLRDAITTIGATVLGPNAQIELVIESAPAQAPTRWLPGWPLVIGVLGLGFFGGMLAERSLRMRRSGLRTSVR